MNYLGRVWRAIQHVPRSAKIALIASALLVNYHHEGMSSSPKKERVPSAFIPHGGGPLPLLGDPQHASLVAFLTSLAPTLKSPSACLVISAHWEAPLPTLQQGEGANGALYYDYYNFPPEAYALDYPLQPGKALAGRVSALLDQAGIKHGVDGKRGFDHGVFVPLKLIYPDPTGLPTIQLSLVKGLDPALHVRLGEALAPLRDEGVLILGSGMSYHNMRGFGAPSSNLVAEPFHEYLREALGDDGKGYEEKVERLVGWEMAPKARENHPREEHLLPLMVILGTSITGGGRGKEVYFDNVAGVKCAGYVFE